jgi:hypothetical protein
VWEFLVSNEWAKNGHYSIGLRDGGSEWHIGTTVHRECPKCKVEFEQEDKLELEIRRLCPKCHLPNFQGEGIYKSLNGYTCPEHFKMFHGYEMPTLGEI